MFRLTLLCPALFLAAASHRLLAADLHVGNTTQLAAALAAAQPGDNILLAPGVYGGGHFRSGLADVTIRSADPGNRAVIRGGASAFQLSDATRVTIADLVCEQQTGNGLNIDDGGSFASPSTNLTIRNVVVRDMQATGNNDGIKLSGVTGFLIENVVVENWGADGSAIDPVGCHNGLIQNSHFRHETAGSSGIRPKGGSKNIVIRANRFEMPATGRAIQAGGSTGTPFFRFIDGDSGYEAAEIFAEGNVVVGASSAFSYVNIDGGHFHHNLVHRPSQWAVRILNENAGNSIVDTQNGRFTDNIVVFNDTASEWSTAVNAGGETLPATFQFARNQWLNLANPTPGGSTPQLPVGESGGIYGVEPARGIDEPQVWEFAWGKWIVNATGESHTIATDEFAGLRIARANGPGSFDTLAEKPLSGDWQLNDLPATIEMAPFSQAILLNPDFFAAQIPGDYDGSGFVDAADYALWRSQFGLAGQRAADGNGDGVVNAADFTIWRDRISATEAADIRGVQTVSEPAAVVICGLCFVASGWAFDRRLSSIAVGVACGSKFFGALRRGKRRDT
jgi:hypothetical protein